MRLSLSVSRLALSLLLCNSCLCLFDSRDPVVRPIIRQCVSETPPEKHQCYFILRCIINDVPSEYSARWSSGASILAFIPTITALCSNSINEVSSIADESTILAIALSLTSVTAFNHRFREKTNESSHSIFTDASVGSEAAPVAWERLKSLILNAAKGKEISWWQRWNTLSYALCLMLLLLSALIWYEIQQTTRYGIVTFACPIKVNVGVWAGLSQLLVLLNILCRKYTFDTRTISVITKDDQSQTRDTAPHSSSGSSGGEAQQQTTPSMDNKRTSSPSRVSDKASKPLTLILRSPSHTNLSWYLQSCTAIASFALYTFGTVVLAGMTMIPASDAVRTMTVLAVGAGLGRLIGVWAMSPGKRGNRTVVVNVPPNCMEHMHGLVLEKVRV